MELPTRAANTKNTPESEASSSGGKQTRRSIFHTLRDVVVGFLVAVILFLLFEGVCSIALTVKDFIDAPIIAERLHTRYDSELGWSNNPGTYIPDMYGPGKYIRINSQGYRDNQDFSPKVPAGKFRIACSGDSFTFGYGVSNDETWCQALESHDPRLQTVNMGEGGYGVDQMYLRYQRDLDRLDLDVHLVAAINADFDRMLSDKFNGYNKPVLKLDHGRLVAGNTPVPKGILQARLVAVSQQLDQIRSVAAVRRIIQKFHPAAAGGSSDPAVIRLKQVLSSMLDSFRDLDRSRNRILVFVYLPTLGEATGAEQYWRPWIEAAARARGIAVIDLLPDFQALPASQAGDMFIREGSMKFIGARGHFTAAGNRFAADKIYSRLLSMPEIKHRLDSVSAK